MHHVVVGSFTRSVVLQVARASGHLAAAGLEVSERAVASSPGQFRSLLDDELHVALTSPDNVVAYRFDPGNPLGGTVDVRIVAAVDRGLGLGLYAAPGTTPAQLAGAPIGVDVPVSGFALALYALAERLGLPRDAYELVALGSTPQRLQALLAGDCAATMLNAGNELVAEQQGCVRLASVAEQLSPYLGTVVAVAGERHLDTAHRLSAALVATAAEIVAGRLDDVTRAAAREALDLDEELADRHLARLRDPREGLVPDGRVDRGALETLVGLRATYLPRVVDGVEVTQLALRDDAGLLTGIAAGRAVGPGAG